MTDVENTDLLLQYMRVVVRQQDGILQALNSMQRQNDNLSAILSQELVRRSDTSRGYEPSNRVRINRPRTRTFFNATNLPRAPPRIITQHRMGNTTINFPGSTSQSTNTVSNEILNATMNDSPVRIRPSFAQIRRSTRTLAFRDISNTTQTICPIDRELLHATDTVLQIIHCGHFFRDTNLRRHFRGNTRCPLCRYDIRDYIPNLEETTYTFSNRRRPSFPPPPPPSFMSPSSTLGPPHLGPPPSFMPPPPSHLGGIEDPFAALPSTNINPSQQTTQEIRTALGEAITDILNQDLSGNVVNFEYSVSINDSSAVSRL